MVTTDLLLSGLDWLGKNYLCIVQLLDASVPVLALSVVGYTIHVFAKNTKGK